MIRLTPQVWTETVDYQCQDCGHKSEGTIEVEETGVEWRDLYCDECGADKLEVEYR